jgi:mono/diheme cytochrome c family protein
MRLSALLCLGLFLVAVTPTFGGEDAVARGRYLAVLGDCQACHTAGHRPPFSGGRGFGASFGTVYSSNITPDRETGIGTWTADQFYRALHEGIAADGRHLYPAFPYVYFARVTRKDSNALYAYLKTLKPIHAVTPRNRLRFPFNIRAGLAAWNALYLDRTPFKPDPSRSTAWNRGAYIVNGLGHCGECHTPKNALFGDELDKAFTGATAEGWFSSNLTADRREGLGGWSAQDIALYLETGRNAHAVAAGAMQEVITTSTGRMRDDDLAAITEYLKSLPAKAAPHPSPASPSQMARGRAVFAQHCAVCHSAGGIAPLFAGNTLVQARKPTTVLKIVLKGSPSPSRPGKSPGFSMPSFAALSDAEIADVVTYIRNNWGNRANAVDVRDVKAMR